MSLSPRFPTYTDDEIIEWLTEMYVSKDRSLVYIAQKSGIDKYKVRRILLKAGVTMRPRGQHTEGLLRNGERQCKSCGAVFPLKMFSKDKTKTAGRGYRCKTCDNLRRAWVYVDEE